MIYITCFNETSSTVSGVGNINAVLIYLNFELFFLTENRFKANLVRSLIYWPDEYFVYWYKK